jgi:hypothetical protein
MPLLGLTEGDVFLIVFAVALPVAAIAFILVGPALRQLGKGRFSVQFDRDVSGAPIGGPGGEASTKAEREAEIRQMVEAKAYRQRARGETPLDVEAETSRLLDERPSTLESDPALVEEVRSLVVARNERRARQGKEPLDVEAEVERQLRDLEDLGQ